MSFRIHYAVEHRGALIRCVCGHHVVEKDGLHAWLDGKSRFWACEFHEVDCKRCLRLRARYLQRRVLECGGGHFTPL